MPLLPSGSLALGVKMNILLYAPAMAAIYLRALGLQRSIIEALRVLLIQVRGGKENAHACLGHREQANL